MNKNAKKYYDTALEAHGYAPRENSLGLKPRTANMLHRYYRGLYPKQYQKDIDWYYHRIKEDVLDGSILSIRGVGETTLAEICNWLVDYEEEHTT